MAGSAIVLETPEAADPSLMLAPPGDAAPRAARHEIRVLLVDDEPQVTEALAAALRRERFDIRTADSADAAIALLEQAEADVVVSDERMPGTSGCSFLAAVKRRWPRTMRVMLSGHADLHATMAAINQASVFRFLTKPCSPSDVAFCIRQAAATQRTAAGPDAALAGRETLSPGALDAACELLWMAYQPIVEAATGRVVAYEALVRCDDPAVHGADHLIACAERLGEVEQLDRRIQRLVAADLPRLPPAAQLLVNVHPRSLLDPQLYAPENPLFPHRGRIVLEITEREDVARTCDARTCSQRLRVAGYRVAVDDLGAGYAGLSTFTTVVPDVVKFDMELIRGIDRSPTKAKLVASMAALCRELRITTIGEGIELDEERRCAIASGCDLLQGYIFGKPARLAAP